MKKILLMGLLILALVALPLCAACDGDDTPVDDTPVDDTPVDDTPVDDTPEVITVTVNDHNPAESTVAAAWDDWGTWVEEQSDGRLDINIIHGGALLANDAEAYQGTKDGVCDIAHYVIDSEQGFLMGLVMSLPFMGWPDQHVEDTYMSLMDEFPDMAAEWDDNLMVLSLMIMPPTQVHTIDTVVVTPADVEGLRLMSSETMTVMALEEAGATASDIPIPEMTPSLMTGLVDGVVNHFPVCGIFGALEALEYHTIFGGSGVNMTPMFAIMNKDFFNGLDADLQQILLDSGAMWTDYQTSYDILSMDNAMAMCADHTFTELTPAQISVWRDLVKAPIHDKWIADCAAAGVPGQALYDRTLAIIADMS